jgi:Putative MetA-pathway of phenol degradation
MRHFPGPVRFKRPPLFFLLLGAVVLPAFCQDNYEIQVYGSETVAPKRTMVEIHSNLTISGTKDIVGGIVPTRHAWHETLEITQGWNGWFETGFYVFSSINPGYGWQYVGSHIRPRVRAPEKWHLPVGLSLSAEIGYQRRQFSQDTWTLEIRPIVDKQLGRWYLAFNPALDRSFHGPGVSQGVTFSPNFKAGYDVTKRINAGLEYYGSMGSLAGFDPFRDQQQQILPVIDLNLGPDWEFNFGVGVGVTHSTDHLLIKMILGRRFGLGARNAKLRGQDEKPAKKADK